MPGISVVGLHKSYDGRTPLLRDVNLEIAAGETFGLVGPNGAGKTTLFGCLLGLLVPDAGRILIDGEPPDSLSARRKIGYVPERQTFDDWMTGGAFLAYHHGLARRPTEDRTQETRAAFDRVGLEPAAFDRRLRRYSRGMLQRIALAQALLGKPSYLFLDEPTSGVDPVGAQLVRRLLAELREEGVTIVVNSHQLAELELVCDRVAFVRAGAIDGGQRVDEIGRGVRAVTVRFLPRDGDRARFDDAVSERVALVSFDGGTARLTVDGDDSCAALVDKLVGSGVRIVEVARTNGRLEHLFSRKSER